MNFDGPTNQRTDRPTDKASYRDSDASEKVSPAAVLNFWDVKLVVDCFLSLKHPSQDVTAKNLSDQMVKQMSICNATVLMYDKENEYGTIRRPLGVT